MTKVTQLSLSLETMGGGERYMEEIAEELDAQINVLTKEKLNDE